MTNAVPGIFTGSITITAEEASLELRRMMTPRQLKVLDATQGCVVSVVFNGQCDPNGLGRALGAALKSMVAKLAEGVGVTEEEAAAIAVPAILKAMVVYAGMSETLADSAIQ